MMQPLKDLKLETRILTGKILNMAFKKSNLRNDLLLPHSSNFSSSEHKIMISLKWYLLSKPMLHTCSMQ